MRLSFPHRAILMLCLAAFGLGPAFVTPRAVRCTGSTGVSRIEFACVKSSGGCCATDPDRSLEADHDEHGPCRDEPAGPLVLTAKLGHSAPSLDEALSPAVELILPVSTRCAGPVRDLPPASTRQAERPPDGLSTLRTVRLVV